jgi:hypothetical protein
MYEYTRRIRPVDVDHPDPLPKVPIVELANNMANDGWELVTASPFVHQDQPHVVLIFRRPKN